MAQIAILGTGYVGLCTAAGFSKLGHRVKCFDVVESKIQLLQSAIIPIYEEGLKEIVAEGLGSGTLSFHTQLEDVTEDTEFVFICVPTPQDEDGSADLSYVLAATANVSPLLSDGVTIVVKSTVPVGTAEKVVNAINRPTLNYVSNPEFLREGSAIWDFFHPDRIVVGSDSQKAASEVADLYRQPTVPKVVTSPSSAELIKYAANSFLAIKLSFVNEIAGICEQSGAEINDVIEGIGLDSRIGSKFLNPGPGWGGSCFPKDTRALLAIAESVGVPSEIVKAAVSSNIHTFDRIVNRLSAQFSSGLNGKKIAIWGLAFKANTDDTRESPALEIAQRLLVQGAILTAFDPIAKVPTNLQLIAQCSDPKDAVSGADALLVLTEWPEFSTYDASEFTSLMNSPLVFDTRRILNNSWDSSAELITFGRS